MITFPFHVVSDPFNKVILNNFLRQKKNLFPPGGLTPPPRIFFSVHRLRRQG
ncbi:hypothetical protein SeGA_4314 [Salmonella enterica subsp. enterica serovar Gaminara str. A4-567]|uniref:Uncharacterized protein n=1 Tax=Salmonella enterica subsp. enterica serovar Montevideo str. S5-403 TaxID=913242 RepID=G5Q1P8_SALMO|nr:hypothetical protein SeGA_4314 [Salmonella enterica subsp. enterica serovar Gaminara str. A4-567]EHC80185.1 hypothetical protein LTSEMON_1787 [Salmonella enterica subsp. enterica serovar Montevideo str. S5-403]